VNRPGVHEYNATVTRLWRFASRLRSAQFDVQPSAVTGLNNRVQSAMEIERLQAAIP
jgi:hypothetical protein